MSVRPNHFLTLIVGLCLNFGAACDALYLDDDCVIADPACGGWVAYLVGGLRVTGVYSIGFGQRAASGQDWWLKKFTAEGVEDTANWNQLFDGGTNGTDQAAEAVLLGDGSIVVGGTRNNAVTTLDWGLRKYSATGVEDTVNWAKSFDGGNNGTDQIFGLAATPDGGVIAVGKRNQLASSDDWWIKKFSAGGVEDTINWDKTIEGGSNMVDEAQDVVVATDGSVFVVGSVIPGATQKDWQIKKFSAAGVEDTVNWNKTIAGGAANDTAFAAALAADGGLYVVGDFNTGNPDMVIKKFSASGVEDTVNWNKQIDGGNNSIDAAIDLAVASDGSVYVVGSATPAGKVDQDWWIKKFSAAGVEDTANWNKQIDGGALQNESAATVQVGPDGSVYVGGSFGVAGGHSLAVIKKFSADGVEDTSDWNKVFNAEATGNNRSNFLLLELGF
jgi:uncharacterized delta-60 repeat protein